MQRLFSDSGLCRADLLPSLSFGLCQKVASVLSDASAMSEIPLPPFFFFLLAAEHRESFAFKSCWTKCGFFPDSWQVTAAVLDREDECEDEDTPLCEGSELIDLTATLSAF